MSIYNYLIRDTDRVFYEEQLAPWLPDRICDCHVHVCPDRCLGPVSQERRKEIWAIEAGINQTWSEMRANYNLLFPNQTVSVLAFGGIYREHDTYASNKYLQDGLSNDANHAHGLFVTRPTWDDDLIIEAMSNGFIGIKPYPDLALANTQEISIYEYLPRRHLANVNRLGGMIMLHLPRAGRLADPENIRELLEISNTYSDITFIVAHIGRSFCLPTAKLGLPHFMNQSNVYFDTAANLNTDVLQFAIETIGTERLLFGSDMPITLMRGMREHNENQYVNYTDGPYSWNTDRKSPEEEAKYTFLIYEGVRALIKAALRSGCGSGTLRRMLLENTEELLNRVSRSINKHSGNALASTLGKG